MKRYFTIGLSLVILLFVITGNAHATTFTVAIPIHNGGTLAAGLEQYDVLEGVGDGIRLEVLIPYSKALAIWELNNAWTDPVGGYTLTAAGATPPDFDGTNKKLGSHAADFGGKTGDTKAYHATLLDTVPVTGFWVSAWVRFDATFDSGASLVSAVYGKDNITGQDAVLLYFNPANGKLTFVFNQNNVGSIALSGTTTSWTGGTWYHIVSKWDTTDGVELWANGSREANDAGETTLMRDGTSNDFFLGNHYDPAADRPFEGNIDSVVFGSGNLTSANIAWLYNSGNGRELVKYSDSSPATTAGWTALPLGTLDMSTTRLVVLKDGVVQDVDSTDVKCQYKANNAGSFGSFLTLEDFRLESDITVTDTTNSINVQCQGNTDSTYQMAWKYKMEIDFTPSGVGGGYPDEDEVKEGVTFGASGEFTGELIEQGTFMGGF